MSPDQQKIVEMLKALPSDKARLEIFVEFCRFCGGLESYCYCQRDD